MTFDFATNCWFVTGATASGKTAVGLEIAERLAASGGGAEILSLDSMAVYRGMDIGTAKPGPAEQAHTPHHLIDLRDPDQEFSVAEYRDAAETVARDVLARGKTPLFVGGTPMYLKCLLRGLFEGPGADWSLRHDLEAELLQFGVAALHERLALVDPVAASNIHRNDARRIVRALEVFRTTGQPISHQQLEFEDARPASECHVFVLRRDRADQHARIEARVDEMMAEGLVNEVRGLTANGRTLGRSAAQAVGYREVLDYLSHAPQDGIAGEFDLPKTIERIQARTRRFAKRQATWFRSLSECRFIDVAADESASQIADRIVSEAG
ncbi:IPP transferase [Botrimarina colliarenosi]|uniref:tRNA dimethylallyltransferase n=1 Tax=Botrimarina colliarenosi TaxID=2528001 RepID=A0A5C6A7N8_9BACT|nr:tRNA (adenosine(37)-N6)-dimethylallyltransferase MiaA [Botrimarina colliarenosi]TWT95944.1 IPP transferase [Botrimarina colliarenosi]